jgi:hypothetical protein
MGNIERQKKDSLQAFQVRIGDSKSDFSVQQGFDFGRLKGNKEYEINSISASIPAPKLLLRNQ